ncbi:hypothetical protein E0Z10_g5323 [Xylaria hypoxylon]|uniref:Rhomboid family membrane protein n=1 Tax=Xylaria hypoxylon TaxID=37992 RepID=A0A4Z0YY63_9PEZI|nr:hypothetical protein E0Z10_g5323 [Xylaria hypoxylon]
MASSASTPTAPPPSSSEPQSQLQTQTSPTGQSNNKNPLIHIVALGVTPLALIALCLPPRRFDLRATTLGGVALWGTNQLVQDYTERSFAQRFSARIASFTGTELPEKAKATQARIREEKERRQKLRALRDEMIRSGAAPAKGKGMEDWSVDQKRALLEAYERQRREKDGVEVVKKEEGEKGIIKKIWMGNAAPDWKEKREQKEKEALQEGGGGYLGLITDQISEVWRGFRKSEGDTAKEKTSDNAKGS